MKTHNYKADCMSDVRDEDGKLWVWHSDDPANKCEVVGLMDVKGNDTDDLENAVIAFVALKEGGYAPAFLDPKVGAHFDKERLKIN